MYIVLIFHLLAYEVDRFQPITHCWGAESRIFCSSKNQLILIDTETSIVKSLYVHDGKYHLLLLVRISGEVITHKKRIIIPLFTVYMLCWTNCFIVLLMK